MTTNMPKYKFEIGDTIRVNEYGTRGYEGANGTITAIMPASDRRNNTGKTLYAVRFGARDERWFYSTQLDPAPKTRSRITRTEEIPQSILQELESQQEEKPTPKTQSQKDDREWSEFCKDTSSDWTKFVKE